MYGITVGWEEIEETYIVRQDGKFIKDDENLTTALEFALAVGEADGSNVIVTAICPT